MRKWVLRGAVAAAVMLAAQAGAQERELTPAEKAAADLVDAALQRQDYAAARTLAAAPDLARVPQVHVLLFQLYEQGRGGPKDEAAATEALRRAAELGDGRSMLMIAERLERAGGGEKLAEAKSWFTAAGNAGWHHAFGHLGRIQWEANDFAGAANTWSKGANGDAFARACLGMAYASGQGIPADPLLASWQFYNIAGTPPNEGAGCVEAAAKAGNAWAQYALALWVSDPNFAGRDPAAAAQLLGAAAEQGHKQARERLAEMLDKGDGVPRDAARAFQLYLAAANAGETRYFERLGEMTLAGDGTAKNVVEAARLFAREEYGPHNYQLGLLYAGAQGHPVDMAKAVAAMTRVFGDSAPQAKAWLKAQADAGNADAQVAYASEIEYASVDEDASGRELSYEESQAAENKLREEASSNYERAARQNHPRAMYKVAEDIFDDNARKLRLMRASAEAGYPGAMLELGRWYTLGWVGLPKDEAMKRAWQERAARTGDQFALASLGEIYLIDAALTSNSYTGGNASALGQVQSLYRLSARYYEAADAAGYEGAAGQLADIYDNTRIPGVGNDQLAVKWSLVAAEKPGGGEDAARLSTFYETGRGVPADLLRAWFWAYRANPTDPSERAEALLRRLSPAQQQQAQRAQITCALNGYRNCML